MNARELAHKYIDFILRYECRMDSDEIIYGVLDVYIALQEKNTGYIMNSIINPLLNEYREIENNADMDYIKELFNDIITYLNN